ncbi:MAG: gliding motility lipoprotein GldD [Thermoflexibacter sp.]|jgi:gliding motility-associated lipoprotein GldD|nr:gliding motility lipoprotein GldD [Thermoflexibacter sp.]
MIKISFPSFKYLTICICAISSLLFTISCTEEITYVPKPKGYHYIALPTASYKTLPDTFPYLFEYSSHAKLLNDSSFLADRYWLEIYYPAFEANIDISYKPITNQREFKEYVEDCFRLAQKHNIKAQAINEIISKTEKGYTSVVYELEGDVPSYLQFYVTDSVKHFLRTSLYFPTSTKGDSLAPIIDFIKKDMTYMMNTIDWNNSKDFQIKARKFKKIGRNQIQEITK